MSEIGIASEMAVALFGDGAQELIAKFEPGGSDLAAAKKERKKRALTAGLSAVGASAGAAGLALGGHNLTRSYKVARAGQKAGGRLKAVKAAVGKEKLATGLIPLEVAGLGGEIMATKILHGDAKKKVKKSYKEELARQGINSLMSAADPRLRPLTKEARKKLERRKKVSKSVDIEFSGEISKMDTDKRQVFGWASVTKVDGQDVHDRQDDYIALEEVEKSAYHYVQNSRKGGDMHQRSLDGGVLQKSDMIESFVVTPEKLEKMGLDPDSLPHGWWTGFKVNDDDLWGMVKEGKRVGFSIHGRGVRTPMEE